MLKSIPTIIQDLSISPSLRFTHVHFEEIIYKCYKLLRFNVYKHKTAIKTKLLDKQTKQGHKHIKHHKTTYLLFNLASVSEVYAGDIKRMVMIFI